MRRRLKNLYYKIRANWRKILLFGGSGVLGLTVIGQILYPSNRLTLFTTIDGINLSGWQKNDAAKQLNHKYYDKVVPIYFGDKRSAYLSPKPSDIGLVIKNEARVNAINYPWYLRIIPTSILWAHFMTEPSIKPEYLHDNDVLTAYINKELGSLCNIKPVNANLKASGDGLKVISSENGGICKITTVFQVLSSIELQLNSSYRVDIPLEEIIKPNFNDQKARLFGDKLQQKIGLGLELVVDNSSHIIPAGILFSWLDFKIVDNQLTYEFNKEKASKYLNSEIESKITNNLDAKATNYTLNFSETSEIKGSTSKKLDVNSTLQSVRSFINGDIKQAIAIEAIFYGSDDIELSKLIQQYATSHTGDFGVSVIELSGKFRKASYNGTKLFTAASTYKLFMAYSTLKRIESGVWNWFDLITSDKDLQTCFDDMIVNSDNTCAEAILNKIGNKAVTEEVQSIGCTNTIFLDFNIETTPNDLALFLAKLQTGQILSQSSRNRLINAMERNVYRQGIPAGLKSSVVADKVGFLDAYLNDAAIIYSPNDTYILVIMTNGSNWPTIADFAAQIEAFRIQ